MDEYITKCYGISQDPNTKDYLMVMEYFKDGNMRQYFRSHRNKLTFTNKLHLLLGILCGLRKIHNKGYTHRNFHSGNILMFGDQICRITGLRFCKSVIERKDENEIKIYGVLPYVAPEVLKGRTYVQAADIYSFGIITHEIISESLPYHDMAHDKSLALRICQGLRPKFNNIKVPLMLEKLINQCLDADPINRPKVNELFNTLSNWYDEVVNNRDTEFVMQFKETDKFNKSLKPNTTIITTTHPQAVYASRILDFKDLPEPQNFK